MEVQTLNHQTAREVPRALISHHITQDQGALIEGKKIVSQSSNFRVDYTLFNGEMIVYFEHEHPVVSIDT